MGLLLKMFLRSCVSCNLCLLPDSPYVLFVSRRLVYRTTVVGSGWAFLHKVALK